MIELKIQYCFRHLRHAGAGVATHMHSGYELVYYASGAGTLMYGEEKIDFLPGCMGHFSAARAAQRDLGRGYRGLVHHF